MKTCSRLARIPWQQTICRNGLYLVLVGALAVFAAGCGKKQGPAPAATPNASTDAAAADTASNRPAFTPPAPSVDKNSPILQQLNRSLIGYRMQKHGNPSSVEDLAAFAGIQLPAPPPGKKYAFNAHGLVVLVDN
jgi:hypothetical protein